MEWPSVFDEVHRIAGASPDELAAFMRSVGQPLSAEEVGQVRRSYSAMTKPGDTLCDSFQQIDPSRWPIPDRQLPESYLSLLRWSNGGDFRTGERLFQMLAAIDVRAVLLAYSIPEYMPGALPFAWNGGSVAYLLDMREPPRGGEFPIVCAHSSNWGWDSGGCGRVADTFLEACRGRINVEQLL
jgi:hypothetical protein